MPHGPSIVEQIEERLLATCRMYLLYREWMEKEYFKDFTEDELWQKQLTARGKINGLAQSVVLIRHSYKNKQEINELVAKTERRFIKKAKESDNG